MTNLTPHGSTDLRSLASEINREHEAAERAINESLDHGHRAGVLLLEAKGQVDHGEWTPWLDDNFEGGRTTARAYMRIARRWEEIEEERQRVTVLPLRDALSLIAEPRDSEDEEPESEVPGVSADSATIRNTPPGASPAGQDRPESQPEATPSEKPEAAGAASGGEGPPPAPWEGVEPDPEPESKLDGMKKQRAKLAEEVESEDGDEPEEPREPSQAEKDLVEEREARTKRGNRYSMVATVTVFADAIRGPKNVERSASLIARHPDEFYVDQRRSIPHVIEACETTMEWLPTFLETLKSKLEETDHAAA